MRNIYNFYFIFLTDVVSEKSVLFFFSCCVQVKISMGNYFSIKSEF